MAQAGFNDEKKGGRKSRWTVPLIYVQYIYKKEQRPQDILITKLSKFLRTLSRFMNNEHNLIVCLKAKTEEKLKQMYFSFAQLIVEASKYFWNCNSTNTPRSTATISTQYCNWQHST